MRGNTIITNGNECVDIKEGSTDNIVEENSCSYQLDEFSGWFGIQGDNNILRFDEFWERFFILLLNIFPSPKCSVGHVYTILIRKPRFIRVLLEEANITACVRGTISLTLHRRLSRSIRNGWHPRLSSTHPLLQIQQCDWLPWHMHSYRRIGCRWLLARTRKRCENNYLVMKGTNNVRIEILREEVGSSKFNVLEILLITARYSMWLRISTLVTLSIETGNPLKYTKLLISSGFQAYGNYFRDCGEVSINVRVAGQGDICGNTCEDGNCSLRGSVTSSFLVNIFGGRTFFGARFWPNCDCSRFNANLVSYNIISLY